MDVQNHTDTRPLWRHLSIHSGAKEDVSLHRPNTARLVRGYGRLRGVFAKFSTFHLTRAISVLDLQRTQDRL